MPPDAWPYGSQQSPIKLSTQTALPVVFPKDYLVVGYPNEPLAGKFSHHNFVFDHPPPLTFAGVEAKLERIHIHARSEHWLDGTDHDFEIHFVNPLPNVADPTAPTGPSTHVVLGVFFKVVTTAKTPPAVVALNKAIQGRLSPEAKRLPADAEPVKLSINPSDFLPANRSQYFRYEGSLTTPDDAKYRERVSWIVYPHLIEVRPEDVVALKDHAQETARPPQEVNRRFILRNFA